MPEKKEIPELPAEEKHRMTARALERTVWYLIDGLIKEGVNPKVVLKVSNQIHAGGGDGMGRRFKIDEGGKTYDDQKANRITNGYGIYPWRRKHEFFGTRDKRHSCQN